MSIASHIDKFQNEERSKKNYFFQSKGKKKRFADHVEYFNKIFHNVELAIERVMNDIRKEELAELKRIKQIKLANLGSQLINKSELTFKELREISEVYLDSIEISCDTVIKVSSEINPIEKGENVMENKNANIQLQRSRKIGETTEDILNFGNLMNDYEFYAPRMKGGKGLEMKKFFDGLSEEERKTEYKKLQEKLPQLRLKV